MRIIFLIFLFTLSALADTKISNLPLLGAASVGTTDTFPFVNFAGNETAQLKISDILSVPSLQSPTFTGTVTANLFIGPLTGTSSGNTTYSANNHGVVLSGSSNAMTVLPPSSSTAFPLISGGSSASPSWAALGIAGGGTGQVTKAPAFDALSPMTTLGDIVYGGSSGTGTRLAGNTTTSRKYLSQTGTGSGSAAPAWATFTPPTIQKFTSSTGTYTTPANVIYIHVRMVGAGGGGGGGGLTAGTGGTGGNTTFGSSLLVANGGVGGQNAGSGGGGAGGSASLGSGPIGIALSGGTGSAGPNQAPNVQGGPGASTPFGGAGGGGFTLAAGDAGVTNSGSGGGGAGSSNANAPGSGGGAGGFVDSIITSPSATYSYAVGAAGTAGAAGTGSGAGGAGGSGVIIVEEFYQ